MELFPHFDNRFRRFGRINARYAELQIEDVPDENAASAPEGEQPAYVGVAVSEAKLRTIFSLITLIVVVALMRVMQLQFVHGAYYSDLAEGNRLRLEPVPSDRGVIYDRHGYTLARNLPNFAAAVRPGALPEAWSERQRVIVRLADIIDRDPVEIERALLDYDPRRASHVVVADQLTHDQAVLLEIESSHDQAVFLSSATRREYPWSAEAPSLSHILGYVGRVTDEDLAERGDYLPTDTIGKAGVEMAYESFMRGRHGRRTVEVDALGRLQKVVATDAGEPGENLHLSLDASLQKDVEKLLTEGMEEAEAQRGAAIVMNARTGELHALVSLPAYDNNVFARGVTGEEYRDLLADPERPLFPRATAGLLPSGSTFKLVVAAAAVAEGVVSGATTVNSVGGLSIGQWWFPDWKAGGHGLTNVTKAIAESVNSFFYVVGGGHDAYPGIRPLGINRIAEYAHLFGFGEKTGIDLPTEASGFIPTPEWKNAARGESWYIGDTYHVAIGQGDVLVTPLQIARMTAVFANGGRLVTPTLVARSAEAAPEEATPIISESVLSTVRDGMRRAVTDGSARSLNALPWPVAGKTGTAQWHSSKANHAWFTSFAPFDDPEITVTVMVEEGGEGSRVGVAVAKAIFRRYFSGELTPVYPEPIAPSPSEATQAVPISVTEGAAAPDEPPPEVSADSLKADKPKGAVQEVIGWIFDSQ
jgi:penicillin-binding protein 2